MAAYVEQPGSSGIVATCHVVKKKRWVAQIDPKQQDQYAKPYNQLRLSFRNYEKSITFGEWCVYCSPFVSALDIDAFVLIRQFEAKVGRFFKARGFKTAYEEELEESEAEWDSTDDESYDAELFD